MMRLYSLVLIPLAALAFASCSGKSPQPPTAGEPKEFSAVCEKANDGKRISLDGYLRFPESFTGNQSVVLRLYKTGDLNGQPIGVQTEMGNQANQVEWAPKKYSDKDLKVHVSSGQIVEFGTKVRVSGDVYFPLVSQDFTCSLSNPLIELAH